MSFLQTIFGGRKQRAPLEPLYRAVVTCARDPFWYREGRVPDTMDGRFDMVAALTALVLIRLEREGEAGGEPSVLLTELFISDMDESMRQIGIGDYVVGKYVGRLMGALGGRLAAFRSAIAESEGFRDAVRRNIFHEAAPSDDALALVAERLERFHAGIDELSVPELFEGKLPKP